MESQWIRFSSTLQRRNPRIIDEDHQLLQPRSVLLLPLTTPSSDDRGHSVSLFHQRRQWSFLIHRYHAVAKSKRDDISELEEQDEEDGPDLEAKEVPKKKKGTVAGAAALIVGTSIGSGILALPKKASLAGLVPSSISMIVCWAFLVIEAFLLVEVNVNLMKRRRRRLGEKELGDDDDLDVISIRTMAEETLGEWGGAFTTLIYVFLGYTSMVAYCSKSGEIIFHLVDLPEFASSFVFTVIFALLISVGGTKATDRVNQWMTASMIGLLLAIEGIAIVLGGWVGFDGGGNWDKVPGTLPVMIFSLVYHDTAPVICAYLGGDLELIRRSVLIGSVVPLLALLLWDAIALSLSNGSDPVVDPVELLLRVRWSGVPFMVEVFSLLAVGTSLIGTLLGFTEFFKEQLKNQVCEREPKDVDTSWLSKWWRKRRFIGLASVAIVVGPSLLVSATVHDAFSTATDIAGGYCMTMLYGILPPAMAWAMNRRREKSEKKALSGSSPALIGIGLFACGVVMEQFLQDIIFAFGQ